ncbi:MAG: SPASM domain-containing protein [Muribaculaceae bacterium]|nr:SPASM domain-containing protein [Muribaculaceae bacterium]
MKLSRYNHFFRRENKSFLYNALSNSFALIENDLYDMLNEAANCGSDVKELDEETYGILKKMMAVDMDDDTEIKKIKYYVMSSRFNPYLLSLTINPTLACNFSCSYCFEKQHTPVFMDDKTENGVVEYIRNFPLVKHLFVTWFGGEPLLAFNRIHTLTEKILNLDIKYNSGMITNGYLLSEDKIRRLDALKISSLQITLDGSPKTHNKRRCLHGGKPTFHKIIDNILLTKTLNPNIRIAIRVNIDRSNESEFLWLYNYIGKMNLPNVNVYPGFVTDISEQDCNGCLYKTSDMVNFLIRLYEEHGVIIPMFYPDSNISSCSVRNPASAVIGPSGELYKCWNDVGDSSKVYGSVFGERINERLLFQYLTDADHLTDPTCDTCKFLPICSGGCPYIRLKEQDTGRKTNNPCVLFKSRPDDFLWIHYKYREKMRTSDKNSQGS